METEKELLQADRFHTQWSAHQSDARDAFIDECKKWLMPIEHHVDEIDCEVHINNVPEVANAIKKVSKLRFFSYTTQVEGKYQVYEEDFEYDFTRELVDLLKDELGYTSSYFLTLMGDGHE